MNPNDMSSWSISNFRQNYGSLSQPHKSVAHMCIALPTFQSRWQRHPRKGSSSLLPSRTAISHLWANTKCITFIDSMSHAHSRSMISERILRNHTPVSSFSSLHWDAYTDDLNEQWQLNLRPLKHAVVYKGSFRDRCLVLIFSASYDQKQINDQINALSWNNELKPQIGSKEQSSSQKQAILPRTCWHL